MNSHAFGTGEMRIKGPDGEWTILSPKIGHSGQEPALAICDDIFPGVQVITGSGTFQAETLADWVNLDSLFGGPPPRDPNRIGGRPETYRFDLCENASRIAINSATGFKS